MVIQISDYDDYMNFVKLPKVFGENPIFKDLSITARVVYAYLLDRFQLSKANGENWVDELGIYIIFTVEELAEVIGCSRPTVSKAKKDLADIGLIFEKRQFDKPNKIYVRRISSINKNSLCTEVKNFNHTNKNSLCTEVKNFESNKTDNIKTNLSRLSESDNNNNINTIYSVFEQEFGRLLSPSQIELIDGFVDEYSEPLVLEALKETVKQGKYHNYNYLRGILDNWKNANLLTVEQVRASQEQRSRNRKHRDSNFEYDEQYNFERIAEEG